MRKILLALVLIAACSGCVTGKPAKECSCTPSVSSPIVPPPVDYE